MLIVALPSIIIDYFMIEYVAKLKHLTGSATVIVPIVTIVPTIVAVFINFVGILGIILIVEDTIKDDGNKINWKAVFSKVFQNCQVI